MKDQELIGLYEAYQQVHTQQRVINEEVEIASHYFCEMGLNEIGVQILIEELGVEEFSEFVYDISEEYYLTEERAAKKRTGGKSYADVKAEIDAKEAAKKKAKEGAALQRQDAMVSASKQQPKRKGFLDSVAGAVLKGIERHKAATDGMGAATRKTAGKIGKAAREFGTGLMSSYDNWVGQLISDGYDLSNWTDEGLFEYYEQLCEESLEIGQSPTPGGKTKKTPVIPPLPPKGTKVNTGYKESYDEPNVLGRLDNLARDAAGRVGGEIGARKGKERLGNILGIPEKIGRERGTERGQAVYDKAKETVGGILKQSYEYDLYDTILEYLISEGYADTNEAALAIMASMSEDWKYSIMEGLGGMIASAGRTVKTQPPGPLPPLTGPAGEIRPKPPLVRTVKTQTPGSATQSRGRVDRGNASQGRIPVGATNIRSL